MIEPITTLPSSSIGGRARLETASPITFAALVTAQAGGGPGQATSRRSDDEPATVGPDVNLAALAAHELVTPGTPRAEVAAAQAEAQSTGDETDSPEAADRQTRSGTNDRRPPARAGTAGHPASNSGTAQQGPPSAAPGVRTSTPPPAEPTPATQGSGGNSRPAEPAAAGSFGVVAAPAGASRTPVQSQSAQAPSGAIRSLTGAGPRNSPVSVFRAPTPTRQPGDAPETFAAQLKRGLAAVLRQAGGSVTVRLAPESLGQVRIRLDMNQGQVSASFDVGSPEARRLLESDLDVLRRTLEARGLRVDDLSVNVRPELAGPKDSPAASSGHPASDSPDQQQASTGGAGNRDPSAGERTDPSDSRQDAADEPDPDLPTIDPWASLLGGAASSHDGTAVLRLRLDAVA